MDEHEPAANEGDQPTVGTGPTEAPMDRWWEKAAAALLGLGAVGLLFVATPAAFFLTSSTVNEALDTDWGNVTSLSVPDSATFSAEAGVVHFTYTNNGYTTGNGIFRFDEPPTHLRAVGGEQVPIVGTGTHEVRDAEGIFVFYGEADLPSAGEYQLTVEHNDMTMEWRESAIHVGTIPPVTDKTDTRIFWFFGVPLGMMVIGAPVVVRAFTKG